MLKENQAILEERLRLYKKHNAEVATAIQRISVWEDALKKGELWLFENSVSRMLGMPHSTTTTSPTESEVSQREITTELVQEWIDEDKSRMHYKKVELEQIEEALKALTKEQRTVIECKYFEGMIWHNIENVFNNQYSVGRPIIYTEMLRKINKEALGLLWEILGPLFQRYLYSRLSK